MKEAIKLAFRNLRGAGLRTWLNAIVLAFALIIVIFFSGLIDGWNEEARRDGIAWDYAQGHLYHRDFDINDPFTYMDGHGSIEEVQKEGVCPILLRSVTLYPQGRMLNAVLKGIDPKQTIVKLPTAQLISTDSTNIPVIIGERMAQMLNVEKGEQVMMRWRDKNGTYDAQTVTIAEIFTTNVPSVDMSQMWIDINKLYSLTDMHGEASYFVLDDANPEMGDNWKLVTQEELIAPLTAVIESKKAGGIVMYIIFLSIGLLAIFDTQVLSIFRRQKEIGTYIALGMTRWQVVRIFTFEGLMYSLFAVVLAAIFGTPLLWAAAEYGYPMGMEEVDMGTLIISNVIYPTYGVGMVIKSILSMVTFATLVSFIPARKIAKLNPILALKGKAM